MTISLSNLVKQYWVMASSNNARIINSNNKVEEKLKKLQEAKLREEYEKRRLENGDMVEGGDGFVEGLLTEQVQEELPPSPEEILEEARQEAVRIIREAKENADVITEDALKEADALMEEKKLQGYSEGFAKGESELVEAREKLNREIEIRRDELEQEYQDRFATMESDLVEAIILVFNKVFHIQFQDKKEIMLHLVKNTLKNVEVGKVFRIHVSDNNYKFMDTHLSDIRERIGNDVEVEIINDANLGSEDCQIETSFGVFDCGIDMELNNLVKDIRSLCS